LSTVPQKSPNETFDALYARTAGLLRYLATVRFHVPADEAEALVSDVYLAYVRRGADVLDPQSWLVGAISHASRKYWRTAGREESLPETSVDWIDDNALNAVTRVIDQIALSAIMERMDERSRDVLHRFYLDGESTSSIAEALGTTTGTVQVLLHTTRKRAQAIYRDLMGRR
jgi:RNA polymerase sigma factor (sigma-70 family)